MSFSQGDQAAARSIVASLGESIEYHLEGGAVESVQGIIDRDVEVIGFDGGVIEIRNEAALLKSDAPRLARGERLVTASAAYEVKEILEDDGVMVRVSIK